MRASLLLGPPSPPLCWRPRGSEAESTSPPSPHPRSAPASPSSTFCLPSGRQPLSFTVVDCFPFRRPSAAGPWEGFWNVPCPAGGAPVRWGGVGVADLHSLKEFPSRVATYVWKTGWHGWLSARTQPLCVPLKCLTLAKSISADLLLPPQPWSIIPHHLH